MSLLSISIRILRAERETERKGGRERQREREGEKTKLFKFFFSSGGIDRSGLFVAMETALTKIEIVEAFNPLEIVRMMRDQRGMMLPALVRAYTCTCIIQLRFYMGVAS